MMSFLFIDTRDTLEGCTMNVVLTPNYPELLRLAKRYNIDVGRHRQEDEKRERERERERIWVFMTM